MTAVERGVLSPQREKASDAFWNALGWSIVVDIVGSVFLVGCALNSAGLATLILMIVVVVSVLTTVVSSVAIKNINKAQLRSDDHNPYYDAFGIRKVELPESKPLNLDGWKLEDIEHLEAYYSPWDGDDPFGRKKELELKKEIAEHEAEQDKQEAIRKEILAKSQQSWDDDDSYTMHHKLKARYNPSNSRKLCRWTLESPNEYGFMTKIRFDYY